MHLPQEIIHHIVEFVHDDRRTLTILRLLNHAWNISASLHLFRNVELYFPPHRSTIDRFKIFLSVLDSNTETISHCVRRLSLGRSPKVMDPKADQQNNDALFLPSIVKRFTHMSDIVFVGIYWPGLTPSLSSCILGICKSPTLERIEFWHCRPTISTFLDILQASSNLKTLRLISFNIEDLHDSEQHHLAQSPSLSSTSKNEYCTNITAPLLQSLTVDNSGPLHVFKVNLKQLNISSDVVSSIKSVGQSLESLHIKLERFKFLPSTLPLDLSHCPRLQHLRISNLPWSLNVCPSTYFSLLFAQTPDQSLPIERLELVISTDYSRFNICSETTSPSSSVGFQDSCHPYQHQCQPQQHDCSNRNSHLSCSGWLTVDDSLSHSRIFQSLKMLHIYIIKGECGVDLSSLSDTFPKLKKQGVQVMGTYLAGDLEGL